MQDRVPLLPRLLISLVVGLVVLTISFVVAWRQYSEVAVHLHQSWTLGDIWEIQKAIDAYRQEKHALPKTLRGLRRVEGGYFTTDPTVMPLDEWRRPLHYWTDGTHYRVTSYGRDGKPGGVGFDYDLSSDDLRVTVDAHGDRSLSLSELPEEAMPTFRQFLTDRASTGMILTCILAGAVAFVLGFRTLGTRAPSRGGFWARVVRLVIITAATVFVAMVITVFHVPSGH